MTHDISSADYLERAQMHEVLADSTADPDARKMHRAMAAAFRRKAREENIDMMGPVAGRGDLLEVAGGIAQRA
jgi:hypothetical protein